MKEVWKRDLNYHKICSTFVLNFLAAPRFLIFRNLIKHSSSCVLYHLTTFFMAIGEITCKLETLPCTAVVQILIVSSNASSPTENCPKKC